MARTAGNHPPQQRIVQPKTSIETDQSVTRGGVKPVCLAYEWGAQLEAECRMGLLVKEGETGPLSESRLEQLKRE